MLLIKVNNKLFNNLMNSHGKNAQKKFSSDQSIPLVRKRSSIKNNSGIFSASLKNNNSMTRSQKIKTELIKKIPTNSSKESTNTIINNTCQSDQNIKKIFQTDINENFKQSKEEVNQGCDYIINSLSNINSKFKDLFSQEKNTLSTENELRKLKQSFQIENDNKEQPHSPKNNEDCKEQKDILRSSYTPIKDELKQELSNSLEQISRKRVKDYEKYLKECSNSIQEIMQNIKDIKDEELKMKEEKMITKTSFVIQKTEETVIHSPVRKIQVEKNNSIVEESKSFLVNNEEDNKSIKYKSVNKKFGIHSFTDNFPIKAMAEYIQSTQTIPAENPQTNRKSHNAIFYKKHKRPSEPHLSSRTARYKNNISPSSKNNSMFKMSSFAGNGENEKIRKISETVLMEIESQFFKTKRGLCTLSSVNNTNTLMTDESASVDGVDIKGMLKGINIRNEDEENESMDILDNRKENNKIQLPKMLENSSNMIIKYTSKSTFAKSKVSIDRGYLVEEERVNVVLRDSNYNCNNLTEINLTSARLNKRNQSLSLGQNCLENYLLSPQNKPSTWRNQLSVDLKKLQYCDLERVIIIK
jgi:hypothetical protein